MMTNATKITFWNGLDTIGGNIVSFEKDNHRLIMDLGALVGADVLELTDRSKTTDLFHQELIPAIDGIYPADQVAALDLGSYEESTVNTAICLSHLHLDHLGNFGQIATDLPVYASQDSVDFYHALAKTHLLPQYQVNWQAVEYGKTIQHGPFKVTFYESDHDTLGASSIFIEADDVKVIYSGDVRLSGFYPEKVSQWISKGQEFNPDILLLEGTTFSSYGDEVEVRPIENSMKSINSPTERKLIQEITKLLETRTDELFVLNAYPQNVTRLLAMVKLAQTYQRKFVFDSAYYQLLKPFTDELGLKIYYFQDQIVKVEQDLTDAVSAVQLKDHPGNYFLQVDYERHQHLFELPQGVYLHSNGVPLGFYDEQYEPFVFSLTEAGWDFYQANVSGHAQPTDLLSIAYMINPAVTVPWHTYKPEVFAQELINYGVTTRLPQKRYEYSPAELLDENRNGSVEK